MRGMRGETIVGEATSPVPIRQTNKPVRVEDARSVQLDSATNFGPSELPGKSIVIIESRSLLRECMTRSLKMISNLQIVSFSSVESWIESADQIDASLVVLCIPGNIANPEPRRAISLLSQFSTQYPTVILADVEDPEQIVAALERGVRGYIPTSVSLEVALEAMHLVSAGGMFVPASSLIAARRPSQTARAPSSGNGMFTTRQVAVVDALRRGKANKAIAFELSMRESTVKVHVRNIMKKLKARNRTEVAYMLTEMGQFSQD
jgi:DNA-binding NarL/FixJ family response regulator